MKKIIAVALTLIICLSGMNALAYKNGDVIGYACYTDIMATINGYEIASYNVDGLTYIIAEDLRNYGFDVIWDEGTRTLSIRRSAYYIGTAPEYNHGFVPQSKVGQKSYNLLYTDIKTYVNNSWVQSHNINGRTIICFDALAQYGKVKWTPEQKTISINIENFSHKNPDPNKLSVKNSFISKSKAIKSHENYMIDSAIMQGDLLTATYNAYVEWGALVDEIYAHLGATMPEADFNQLKNDQIAWASKRDWAMKAELDANGETASYTVGNLYMSDRCYYLTSLIKVH